MNHDAGAQQEKEDEEESFFEKRKQAFKERLLQMGRREGEVDNLLNNTHLLEENVQSAVSFLNERNYVNPLRMTAIDERNVTDREEFV